MRDLGNFEVLRESMYDYLVDIRDSGVTNMWGAPAYVQAYFKCSNEQAKNVFLDWIETF